MSKRQEIDGMFRIPFLETRKKLLKYDLLSMGKTRKKSGQKRKLDTDMSKKKQGNVPNDSTNMNNLSNMNNPSLHTWSDQNQFLSYQINRMRVWATNSYPSFYNQIPATNGMSFSTQSSSYQHLSQSTNNSNRGGSSNRTEEPIGDDVRKWEDVGGVETTKPGTTFKLMSYNVLAQNLLEAHPYLYRRNKSNCLQWSYRWNSLVIEINKHKSDILCFQEVASGHLREFYVKTLKKLGYEWVHKKRTGERQDGCAIFYKGDMFNMVEYTTVEFNQPNVDVLNRDNIGIIVRLAPIKNKEAEMVVATTHLLYNPKRDDVRLAQMQLFLTEIERMSYKNRGNSEYVPIILTGDLNSPPESVVVDFLCKSQLQSKRIPRRDVKQTDDDAGILPTSLGITDNCQHIDLLNFRLNDQVLSRDEESQVIQIHHTNWSIKDRNPVIDLDKFNTGLLSHKFNFRSVYEHRRDGDIEGTSYQNKWHTVDYIFYSGETNEKDDNRLQLLSRYTLPLSKKIKKLAIPNDTLGSDHLALLAQFKLVY